MSRQESDPLSILARNIEQLMRSRDLTVDGVAEKSGIERGRIDAFLECECEATAEDLIRLAGAFEVEPGRLLE